MSFEIAVGSADDVQRCAQQLRPFVIAACRDPNAKPGGGDPAEALAAERGAGAVAVAAFDRNGSTSLPAPSPGSPNPLSCSSRRSYSPIGRYF